jgi:hypothetical protein
MQLIISSFLKNKYSLPFIQNDELNQSRTCLLHNNAHPHITSETGTSEEMQWEKLPHPTYTLDLVKFVPVLN